MATLRANGPALLRISSEKARELSAENPNVTWERYTRVYHANGVVLQKIDVVFKPTFEWDPPKGRPYSWGWKKVIESKRNPDAVKTAKHILSQIEAGTTGSRVWVVEFKAPELEVKP